MPEPYLLDFDDLPPLDQPGVKLEGTIYPWATLGPIETAKLAKFHEQIRDLATGDSPTVEEASEVVRLMRLQLQTILPTMPETVMEGLTDARVETALRFFDLYRMNDMANEAEQRLEPAARMTASADQVDELNKRIRRIGDRSFPGSNGSTVATPATG